MSCQGVSTKGSAATEPASARAPASVHARAPKRRIASAMNTTSSALRR